MFDLRIGGHVSMCLAALLLIAACSDGTTPTRPLGPRQAALARNGGGGKLTISDLQLASTTLQIDGDGVDGSVTVSVKGAGIPDVSYRGEIVQGAATREAASAVPDCGAGAGTLPRGDCTTGFTASASNSAAGSGTLTAGSATFVLHVVLSIGGTETELASQSIDVTLAAAGSTPTIKHATLTQYTVLDASPSGSYSFTLENLNANSFSNVWFKLSVTQGAVSVTLRDAVVSCGSGAGVLPSGTCTVSGLFSVASESGFVPGAAVLEAQLSQGQLPGGTAFDNKSIDITLVPDTPSIVSLVLESTTLTIGGGPTNYTVSLYNPTGSAISPVLIQGTIVQGDASRDADGTDVLCGGTGGILPSGACAFQFVGTASNTNSGTGTLVAGAATFQLTLRRFDSGTGTYTDYDVKSVLITLVDP